MRGTVQVVSGARQGAGQGAPGHRPNDVTCVNKSDAYHIPSQATASFHFFYFHKRGAVVTAAFVCVI